MKVIHNSSVPEYRTWLSMKRRVKGFKKRDKKNYTDKGIDVCEEWKNDFEKFYHDMHPRPEGYSIDRIDSSKGYYKENCRWANIYEQNNNKENNIFVSLNGVKITLMGLADFFGLKYDTLFSRLFMKKWDIEKSLTTKIIKTVNNGYKLVKLTK